MLNVELLSPEQTIDAMRASEVLVPSATKGILGILPGHSSFITELGIGEVIVKDESEQHFFVSGGYLQIDGDNVKILADVVEGREGIDESRAQSALERASKRLEDVSNEELDIHRAQNAQKRAEKRLEVKLQKSLIN